jgi:hypothetical protein
MEQIFKYGSVRGAPGNRRPCREQKPPTRRGHGALMPLARMHTEIRDDASLFKKRDSLHPTICFVDDSIMFEAVRKLHSARGRTRCPILPRRDCKPSASNALDRGLGRTVPGGSYRYPPSFQETPRSAGQPSQSMQAKRHLAKRCHSRSAALAASPREKTRSSTRTAAPRVPPRTQPIATLPPKLVLT